MANEGFVTPRTFRFLRELERNNDRDWFNANKQQYIDDVRDPMLAFIGAFGPRLTEISANMEADPRPFGGSLMRIYRDTRFSKDKRPYKTNVGVAFRHRRGRDIQGPVFYLHLEPGSAFAAAGMWHPPSEALKQVRDAIVAHPDRWKRATERRGSALDDGDRLKRPPRGYAAEHPLVEDLMRKSFTASTVFTEAQACAPNFLDQFSRACRQSSPLIEFLTTAVGLEW